MNRQFTKGFCAESYEMAIGVVIFLLTLITVCFLVFCSRLPSQLSRNFFWWIWMISTRRPRTAGSIPAQEDERAMIRGKQTHPVDSKRSFRSLRSVLL